MASMYVNGRIVQSNLEEFNYTHYWVNHRERWVDEIYGDIHINGIERAWRSLKSSISHIKRSQSEEILDSHIANFMLKCNLLDEEIYDAVLSILGHIYGEI
jgi:hypothetical protein